MLRWPLPIAIVALMAVPAGAADQSVTATPGNSFSPAEVTIDLGDTVTWNNGGGFHNVKFDDGSFEEPAEPAITQWSVQRTFTAPGHYRYYCEAHGGPNGAGMAGHVAVRDATGTVPEESEQPPGLSVSAAREQPLARLRRRGARARTRCANGCEATFRLTLAPSTAQRFGFERRRTTIGRASAGLAPATSTGVAVRLTRTARRRLAGAKRPFEVRLDVRAVKGTAETARRTIEIKP